LLNNVRTGEQVSEDCAHTDSPVTPLSTATCGKPGTGCDVMYQTAWRTSVACKRLWSTSRVSTHNQ